MSFGLHDKDWVDPDPEPDPVKCCDCDEWERCPCGCSYGWCRVKDEFTAEDDEC